MKKNILFVSIFLVLFLGTVAFFVVDLWRYANRAPSPDSDATIIDIPPGQPFKTTAEILRTNGIIHSPIRFSLIARLKGYDKKLQAGEYLLSGSMAPLKILEKLVKGEIELHKLTIPEGYNINQIAELIAEAGFCEKAEIIKLTTDIDFVKENAIAGETLEGYLFPDTYFFPKDVTAKKILTTMVDRFWSIYKAEWENQRYEHGLSVHQVVTLASIIEKETSAPSERPIISSVFHNRLKKRMRLESDPTVIYAIKDFDGNLTREHLSTKTAYNTYKIRGLPPGPIANPGIESLQAALFPADTAYFYFVSKKDHTHHFSTNLNDHNQAVIKYQLKR